MMVAFLAEKYWELLLIMVKPLLVAVWHKSCDSNVNALLLNLVLVIHLRLGSGGSLDILFDYSVTGYILLQKYRLLDEDLWDTLPTYWRILVGNKAHSFSRAGKLMIPSQVILSVAFLI